MNAPGTSPRLTPSPCASAPRICASFRAAPLSIGPGGTGGCWISAQRRGLKGGAAAGAAPGLTAGGRTDTELPLQALCSPGALILAGFDSEHAERSPQPGLFGRGGGPQEPPHHPQFHHQGLHLAGSWRRSTPHDGNGASTVHLPRSCPSTSAGPVTAQRALRPPTSLTLRACLRPRAVPDLPVSAAALPHVPDIQTRFDLVHVRHIRTNPPGGGDSHSDTWGC